MLIKPIPKSSFHLSVWNGTIPIKCNVALSIKIINAFPVNPAISFLGIYPTDKAAHKENDLHTSLFV